MLEESLRQKTSTTSTILTFEKWEEMKALLSLMAELKDGLQKQNRSICTHYLYRIQFKFSRSLFSYSYFKVHLRTAGFARKFKEKEKQTIFSSCSIAYTVGKEMEHRSFLFFIQTIQNSDLLLKIRGFSFLLAFFSSFIMTSCNMAVPSEITLR